MRIVPSPVVLGVVCICALGGGCAFNSAGLPWQDAPRPDAPYDRALDGPGLDGRVLDGPVLDGRRSDASRDVRRDRPLLDQLVRDLHPAKDVQPWPDRPAVKADTGCLVETFTSGMGQVQPKSGQWAVNAGALRQSQTGGGNYAAIGGVTASNYVVSALITVHSTFSKPGWVVGASLGVRLQPGAGLTPRQYLCGIYPGGQGLVIVHCSGGDPNSTCSVVSQTGPAIAVGQQVLVRATIVGASLTCELPQLGGSSTYSTGGLTSGGPTLITQFVDASYDDLSVCALAP